jgi:hypothetical protein
LKIWNKICGVFCLLALPALGIKAQNHPYTSFESVTPNLYPAYKPWKPLVGKWTWGSYKGSTAKILQINDISAPPFREVSRISADYAARKMAFFCQEELKCEKLTGIPFRFRVGSLEDCDWLEQKPNALPPSGR